MPEQPPDNRPSVISAQTRPSPVPFMNAVGCSISCIPGPRRAQVADHQHLIGLYLLGQDRLDRRLLALDDPRRTSTCHSSGNEAGAWLVLPGRVEQPPAADGGELRQVAQSDGGER